MITIKDMLLAAGELIQATGWCQGRYALKNGKTFYDFCSSGQLVDSYCLVGALAKVAHDFWMQEEIHNAESQIPYNVMSHNYKGKSSSGY